MARVPPSMWRKSRSSRKLRERVFTALADRELTPGELASELNLPRLRVCSALNDLMIAERVYPEECKFRRNV